MHKRIVKPGHKHGTATFYTSGDMIPLNFNDLALHLVLTANDNCHRTHYPLTRLADYLTQLVHLGYRFKQVKTQQDFEELEIELDKIYSMFYGKRKNFVNLEVDCDLPNKDGSMDNFFG